MPELTAPQQLRELPLRILPPVLLRTGRPARPGLGGRGSAHLVERHARVYRHTWGVLISGVVEAPVLPAVDRHWPRQARRYRDRARRAPGRLHQLRRSGSARHLGDERRGAGFHLQRVLPPEIRQALRFRPGYADAGRRDRARRDRLGATFYPLSVYPRAIQIVIEVTPLYQGIVLLRGLTLGVVGPGLVPRAAYLAVMGLVGLFVAGRRIRRLLLS
jgi:hypothetical protein